MRNTNRDFYAVTRSRFCVIFCNMVFLQQRLAMSSPHPHPKLVDCPFSAVLGCIFSVVAGAVRIWRQSVSSSSCESAVPLWQAHTCTILNYAVSHPRTILVANKRCTCSLQPSYMIGAEELARGWCLWGVHKFLRHRVALRKMYFPSFCEVLPRTGHEGPEGE